MTNKEINNCKKILNKIETIDIIKNIEQFREINLRTITDENLSRKISDTISVKNGSSSQSILFPRLGSYQIGTRFYRVRELDKSDHFIPLQGMLYEKDAWNAPEKGIKRGRINKEGESLLYTSPVNPSIAVEELKVKNGELFCLIVYEALDIVKVNMIGQWIDEPQLTSDENLKMRLINNFLRDEFTRDVGEGTEYLYRVSEMISKDYFDLPPRVIQDAWCYPSISNKKAVNVCFRPEIAKQVLTLVGVQICTVKKTKIGHEFSCKIIASGFNEENKFIYHEVSSVVFKIKFPEIRTNTK